MKPPVLLLDDDQRWLQICLSRLPQAAYTLEPTVSLPDALQRLEAVRYPVVVCDLRLIGIGERGGFELLTRAKTISEYTKVIIITAYGGAATNIAREAWMKGAFNYLTKPLDFAELDTCITMAIQSWQQEVEAMAKIGFLAEGPESTLLRDVTAPPPESPPEDAVPAVPVNLTRLRQVLVTRFDEGELRTLCFDLRAQRIGLDDLDYASLPGEGKADKARELVAYLERRDSIPALVEIVRRLRPNVSLSDA